MTRYYYVPSTYHGLKFGSGVRAGAMRGYGQLVGMGVGGMAVMPTNPKRDLSEMAIQHPEKKEVEEKIEEKVEKAEATGKPAQLNKTEWKLWSALKNDLGNVKRWVGNNALPIAKKVGKFALQAAPAALALYSTLRGK